MSYFDNYQEERKKEALEELRLYEKAQEFANNKLIPYLKEKKLKFTSRFAISYFCQMRVSEWNDVWLDFVENRITYSFTIMSYLFKTDKPYNWKIYGYQSKDYWHDAFTENELTVESAYKFIMKTIYGKEVGKDFEQISLFDLLEEER